MHDVKWSNITLKSCGVHKARFLDVFDHFSSFCMKGLKFVFYAKFVHYFRVLTKHQLRNTKLEIKQRATNVTVI